MWLISVYLLALNSTGEQAAAVVTAAAVTGALAYLAASRSTSGDIRRTSPDKLWDAAEDIRRALTTEVEARRAENELLRIRLATAESRIDDLLDQVRSLKAQLRRE